MSDMRDTIAVSADGSVALTIACTPVAKPRMTQRDKWKQRECVMRYREWCDRVRAVVGDHLPLAVDIAELNWVAYFKPAASWSKKRQRAAIGQIHRQTPDRDNIDKAVLDCLFKDDSGIGVGKIEKRWDWNARLEVEIITISEL